MRALRPGDLTLLLSYDAIDIPFGHPVIDRCIPLSGNRWAVGRRDGSQGSCWRIIDAEIAPQQLRGLVDLLAMSTAGELAVLKLYGLLAEDLPQAAIVVEEWCAAYGTGRPNDPLFRTIRDTPTEWEPLDHARWIVRLAMAPDAGTGFNDALEVALIEGIAARQGSQPHMAAIHEAMLGLAPDHPARARFVDGLWPAWQALVR
jgi:hypothetical protein